MAARIQRIEYKGEEEFEFDAGFFPGYTRVSFTVVQAVGSGVERFVDTEEVTGSNPVPPIDSYFTLMRVQGAFPGPLFVCVMR